MESQFTYEHLSNDPTGLLHKRNVAAPIGPFDGRLGALVEKGWFMVTPNALGLYQPPLGINREMYMRADFRYAADDPLLWPQFYVRSDPWLSCIRKRPKDPLDPFLPLYNPVARSDFSTSGSASQDSQLGKFSDASFICLRAAAQKVIDIIRLAVAETQRVAIEMRAIMDYITIYLPTYAGNQSDTELIGAFTTDPIIIEEFFRARIPVWLLLKLDRLPFTRIDAYTSPLEPNQYLNIESPRIRLRSVFIGASDQAEKYKAFQALYSKSLEIAEPFCARPRRSSFGPSSTRAIVINTRKTIAKQKHPSQSNQTRFLSVIVHPRLPPAIPVWQAAVESTSSDRSRCYPEARIAEANGYIFPRPDIFIGAQDELQSSRTRESMAMPTSSATGTSFLFIVFSTAVWRGIELEMLTNDHHREIAWELAELNFRFELLALDARAATNGGNHDLLLRCLPNGLTTAFVAVDVGSANHGLGHPTWRQRAPYVFPLMNAMRSWKACPHLIQQKRTNYTEAQFDEIEKCVALFYVESFFRFFGRAPVIPRHLPHSPQTSFVPETCEEMYTERSGLVFDIAQFHEQ
ncbi:uncharacterized protein EV420DRAFT_1733361 [Desarmillaria tabescens]|uniref:Uncharacterized protein n=1 Tax=Armillaria tabescens TaxID=1929756 RepID=A0AA39JCW8_ARMTA|nr:uncharacterized protein EV420DRAFT_1733361 [Desarmillaria tabescens]KAK0440024.1 hypothetical protein EV420DRAFT_1733361 [Desarmillaria tabescens]